MFYIIIINDPPYFNNLIRNQFIKVLNKTDIFINYTEPELKPLTPIVTGTNSYISYDAVNNLIKINPPKTILHNT